MAFLQNFREWRGTTDGGNDFRLGATMSEALQMAIDKVPKPLPGDLVLQLLRNYGSGLSWMLFGFPLRHFLSLLTRNEMTDEIRAELRRIMPHYSPTATGKIEPHLEEVRKLIVELIWVEGEKPLDPGRGPWSQIVFDQFKEYEEVARIGWEGLLEHCRSLEQTVPGAKWNKRSRELMAALGEERVTSRMLRWLALGPTPNQPRDAISPIEDSAYQKGVIWCLRLLEKREAAQAITDFALACLRKIPMIGAVSQKVGFAGVQALGAMDCTEAVAQLTRLRAKVKYTIALKLIEKSLQQAAERSGISREELEDFSLDGYGLDQQGTRKIMLEDVTAHLQLATDGGVSVSWWNAEGKLLKSPPPHVRKGFSKEIRALGPLAKEIEQSFAAQRFRIESSFLAPRSIPLQHWLQYYVEHPLLGFLGRRLIWAFSDGKGWERSGMWLDGRVRDAGGSPLDLAEKDFSGEAVSAAFKVRLWHPLTSNATEVQHWRERIFSSAIRQPFRQAFREFYEVSEDERQTRMYSNRFAGFYLRQHQLASLCRARGWEYRLMGSDFDGHNVPTRNLPQWNMQVQVHVDLPPDRDNALRDSGLGERSGFGINLFVESDQVRFYRDRHEIAVDEVPAMIFSEMMRDVDLFTSVCAIGEDENWRDEGDRTFGVSGERITMQELSAAISLRSDILTRVLPLMPIADRCRLEPSHLEVLGQLGRYRISLALGLAALVTDSGLRRLKIQQKLLAAVVMQLDDVPAELDYRTEMILRKAHLLADDWKIEDPELIRQFMPK
ncbi:DUF4132 domain-containing protein [Telmatobacter sp. DSM 110680]|uniref:DUF4132 domain-containing protein n=1 Tax=Telmatobacter sp. DSM 110680 TaxID=3036704 RepID=A0AAU7DI74_9BACT